MVEVENWDYYLWLVVIRFPEAGIEITNHCDETCKSRLKSRISIDMSLTGNLGDWTHYSVNLETGVSGIAEWYVGKEIAGIVEKMSNNLQEAVRVLKLRDLMKPLIRNEDQFIKTVEAMYHVKSMT